MPRYVERCVWPFSFRSPVILVLLSYHRPIFHSTKSVGRAVSHGSHDHRPRCECCECFLLCAASQITRPLVQVTYFIYKRYEPANIPSAIFLLLAIPGLLVQQLRSHFSDVLSAIAAIFSAYWAFIIIYTIAYRLSPFHPLAKYPGPLLCKVSKLWVSHIASTGKYHLYAKELHDQYGEMVRIGGSARC